MIPRDIRNGCLTIVVMLVLWAVGLVMLAGCSGACYTQDETGALIGCAEEVR